MGIRALIGADAPGDVVACSNLQNAVALIGLEQDSEIKSVGFRQAIEARTNQ